MPKRAFHALQSHRLHPFWPCLCHLEFAKSIGNMNATISDAEEMVYNQDKLFSDMDSLLMMQKVRLIFFNENSTHTAISYT